MVSSNEGIKQVTANEWRALGFSYDFDDDAKEWRLKGDRRGLAKFAAILRAYALDPSNEHLSEHEHYGPYLYLKFVTSASPKIAPDGIYGRLSDLELLAMVVDKRLSLAQPGAKIRIDR